jgi:hypothetical protein
MVNMFLNLKIRGGINYGFFSTGRAGNAVK